MTPANKFVSHFIDAQVCWDGLTSTGRLFISTITRFCHWLCMAVAPKICSSWTTESSWKEVFHYCSRVMTVLHNSLASSLAGSYTQNKVHE